MGEAQLPRTQSHIFVLMGLLQKRQHWHIWQVFSGYWIGPGDVSSFFFAVSSFIIVTNIKFIFHRIGSHIPGIVVTVNRPLAIREAGSDVTNYCRSQYFDLFSSQCQS